MTVATPAHRPAAAAAGIAGALLLPQDRIAREPLDPWAARLRTALGRALGAGLAPRALADSVAGIANNTALIATHLGRGTLARALCEAQFRWQASLAAASGDAAITPHVLQPWVNLARLDALEGAWERSLARLARVERCRAEGEVVLDGVRVGPGAWRGTGVERHVWEHGLEDQYVLDSLKALLANARFAEVLDGAVRIRPGARRSIREFADEARVVAACRLGRHDEAAEVARRGTRESAGWPKAVFRLRLAETLACAGDARGAVAAAAPLAGVMALAASRAAPELKVIHILARAAALCAALELHAQARALAAEVHAGAAACRDEALQIEALRILVALDGSPQHAGELARLQAETAYPRLRAAGPAAECPQAEALFGEMAGLLGAAHTPSE